ncbi:Phage tail tape measure protein [uncultured Caudovirales phage]|uniref:Phage tail tape measure protein n=1 Tax=uncultured Caudovirales phage TaxID=2100421 RepID=A0A6J5N8Z8_9CAUD|nr:Phage tail tape measure protein [uncultured Caudovirales phage]
MAKQIKRSDIVEKDIFKNLIDSATDSIDKLEQMNDQFKEMAKTIKSSMSSAKFGTTKELNEFIKSTKTATQLSKEQAKVMQELEKANALRAKAEAEFLKTEKEKLKVQDQAIKTARTKLNDDEKQAKIDARRQKSLDDEGNAYKRLEKNTRELKNQSKQLGAELRELELAGKRNTKEYNETAKAFRNVTDQARNGDQALKKLDSQVGDNFRNVGNYEGAINKLGKGLGMLGLAFGVGDVIQGAGRTIIDFDQSIADLVSITGAGGKDLEYFKEQSIQLGKGVEGGAKNVIEAYKLIGSAKPELLANAEGLNAVTESAIKLAKASGMDLPASATALTDALNQFGAPAEDAGKFINILANGALFGSAEIPQVTEALLKFGAVAKTSNVSIQESTALIEMLASKGLKGAEAGTALRNVMLKLSAPDALPKEAKEMLSGLGIDMKKLADTSIPFADRLKALSPILKDETAQIKVFGTENVVSAKNLLMNIDGIKQLTKDMDTKGTVDKQATDRTKTLNQALVELKGAWDEIVLSFSSGSGASAILTESLSFIARNLGTILSVITKLAIAYGTMIAIQKAKILWNKLEGKSLSDIGGYIKQAITGTKKMGDAQTEASAGAKALGTAMKTIGFAIAIELAIELVKALYDIASGASQAREDMARLEVASEKAMKTATANIERIRKAKEKADEAIRNKVTSKDLKQEDADKLLLENSKQTKKQIEQNKKLVDERKRATYKDLADLKKLRAEFDKNNNDGFVKDSELNTKLFLQLTKKAVELGEKYKIKGDLIYGFIDGGMSGDYQDVQAQLQANYTALAKKSKVYGDEVESLTAETNANTATVKGNTKTIDENSGSKNKNKKETKDLNTEFKEINETISEQKQLLNELDNIYKNRVIDSKIDEIKTEYDKQINLAETTGEANVDLLEKLLQEETDLKKIQAEENLKFKIDQLQAEYEALVESKKKELELERDTLLKQKDLTPKARQEILDNYKERELELNAELEKSKADTELKKKILVENSANDIKQIEKDKNDKINEYNDGVYEALKRWSDKSNEDLKQSSDTKIEDTKKMYEEMNKLAKMSADYFIKQSEKKITQIEGELNALSQQKQFLEQMAVNGNITAEKSLAQNEKLTAEANKKKAQELKKQERIKLAETVFTSYMENAKKGEGNAIVKTISDISVLTAFINSLPAFYTGTERTVAESLGSPHLQGKDGYIVRVDGSEKILNPELSKMTGNMTTMEIAKLSEDKLRGRLMTKNGSLTINPMNNEALLNKMDQLNNTIANKPETNIELGEIVGGVMHVIESSKNKNTITRNITRFS